MLVKKGLINAAGDQHEMLGSPDFLASGGRESPDLCFLRLTLTQRTLRGQETNRRNRRPTSHGSPVGVVADG